MMRDIDKAISVAEIAIIKRDFDLLRKLAMRLMPELQLQLLPYAALFCSEVIEYLNNKGFSVEIEQTSKYSIKDVRQKAKFFDIGVKKLLQSIENIDELQDDYFVGLMKHPELRSWNAHDNLGIYYDGGKNIIGNTHYGYYVFQDEDMFASQATP